MFGDGGSGAPGASAYSAFASRAVLGQDRPMTRQAPLHAIDPLLTASMELGRGSSAVPPAFCRLSFNVFLREAA